MAQERNIGAVSTVLRFPRTPGRSRPDAERLPAPLLSVEDVAGYLGVSPRWVYAQVRSGRLPAMFIARSWRLRQEAVDRFADSFAGDVPDTGGF